ncbi:MAG TPA: TldD/PmbA family protein [Gemmatimonadaceae bacterium]|nr:TldD/PmbA family protein [Gemmatimonadaceae bacterium]
MRAPKRLIPIFSADGGIISRADSQAMVDRVVKMSKAESISVNVTSNETNNLRFAANQVSTAGSVADANVAVTSSFGPKRATVVTNNLTDEALRATVKQSETLAKLAPDDPEAMPDLGPQSIKQITAEFPSTVGLTADQLVRAGLTALEPARKAGDLLVAGYLVSSRASNALGNSKGLFAYHNSSNVNYTVTARTADGTGSGWAGGEHPDWTKLDVPGISARAIEKARLSRNPVAVEPGKYTVIFEPQAVGDLVQLIGFYGDARSSDEGRSPFTKQGGGNKIGEKILDPRVTITADPFDPMVLAQPWDFDGLPLGRQTFIDKGVLKELYYSRFWAKKQGKQPTGAPTSFIMSGGTSTVEDMIKSTPRGILVTRLWYLREVDPRTILYTGLTRDGTFLIENGKISKAVKNFRFNDSPLFMLNNLEAMGRPVRLAGTEAGGAVIVPPIKVKDFNFTSLSDAV